VIGSSCSKRPNSFAAPISNPQPNTTDLHPGSLIVFALLGLDTKAAAVYTAFTALGEFFYHTNVRTPQWVGYLFQRPEMHRIHHEKDKHRNNYGDIVWWDMLFGTYQNPPTWDGECGFTEEREQQLGAMLAFQDVHR
jgi:sterol desaturase/sphingolipid hydroxylase (fatty acid hydroxylase superfamily)